MYYGSSSGWQSYAGRCGIKKEKTSDSELPEIVIGMDYFEPCSYQASDGEYKGIDVELAKEAFQRLGYQPKFEKVVWEDKDETSGRWNNRLSVELLFHEWKRRQISVGRTVSVQSSDGGCKKRE